MSKHGHIGQAAMKADMDRKTARKYVADGKFPSEMTARRDWRTRIDPFEEHWSEVEARLVIAPELEAKTLFEALQAEHPERYEDGQLRTLQRRIRWWRAARGPDQDVSLPQQHRAGEAAQTDFTSTAELGVTIAGLLFVHLLCVLVLPYSNWQWATVCLSESMVALRKGVQRALFQLGRVPTWHQTDNSTAATHRIGDQAVHVEGRKRPFNAEYVKLMDHLGMKPRTTGIGEKEQNGDVEASNGAIKRRLDQALHLRGSRDFESVEAWQAFIDDVLRKANANRGRRVGEDLAEMRALPVTKLPEHVVEEACVSDWSTIRVKHCAYSVPSRLIGSWVRVWIFEDKIEVYFANPQEPELACDRLRGRNLRRIDYRHMIKSLVRKPGGFERYLYREEMFPSVAFRRAYDAIQTPHRGTKGDLAYLRILDLAASTMEADVTVALELLLTANATINVEAVKALIASTSDSINVPALLQPMPDLTAYDALLTEAAA